MSGCSAGGDRRVHRRAERRPLLGADHVQRHPRHVGVDLHHERVADQPAGDDQLARRQAGGRERVEDHARAERGRLDQRAVDVLGAGGEREADEHAAELVVDEHGAVAVEPVEREQPVRADLLRGRELGQVACTSRPRRAASW